ncbi:MAG: biotin/lipoyl-binding protein [Phycisphaeraceae bacterium]|nr:biotin/lipoyl-binding protein [Phycisphaeraceae bacterium]
MKLRITVENVSYDVDVEVLEGGAAAAAPAAAPPRAAAAPRPAPAPPAAAGGAAAPASGDKCCKAPIAGTVVQIKVKAGDQINLNQVLVVMEAMKMETNIASPIAGKVKGVRVNPGQAVKSGEVLVDFE